MERVLPHPPPQNTTYTICNRHLKFASPLLLVPPDIAIHKTNMQDRLSRTTQWHVGRTSHDIKQQADKLSPTPHTGARGCHTKADVGTFKPKRQNKLLEGNEETTKTSKERDIRGDGDGNRANAVSHLSSVEDSFL